MSKIFQNWQTGGQLLAYLYLVTGHQFVKNIPKLASKLVSWIYKIVYLQIYLFKISSQKKIWGTKRTPVTGLVSNTPWWVGLIHKTFLCEIMYYMGMHSDETFHELFYSSLTRLPNVNCNKTQYDWFPGKSQNSKKFSAKFKQNPTTSKNHRVFLNILEG